MKKKLQLFLFLSINTTLVIGQTINLINQTNNQVDSKIVYIGIDNRFQVKGYENIEGIKSMNSVKLIKDNLIIKPATVGKLFVTFNIKDGKAETISFQVERIPDPIITIGENEVNSIVKSSLSNNRVLLINSANKNPYFFDGYNIEYFEAQLNGEKFVINDNKISEELLQVILKAKSNDKLILSSLKAYNKKLSMHFNITSLVFNVH